MKYKAAIFDVDGVLNRQPELFAAVYAREHQLGVSKLVTFFDEEFEQCSLGKADLKQLIAKRNDLWQWPDDPQELLNRWFENENYPDHELLQLIDQHRQAGLKVYVATIQEKYRAHYLQETLFKDRFDGLFISCELGLLKRDLAFYKVILERVRIDLPNIKASEIVYFDDKQEGLDTADQLGIKTHLYEDIVDAKKLLNS